MRTSIRIFIFVLGFAPTLAMAQVKSNIDIAVSRFQQFYNKQETDSIFNMLSPRSQGIMNLEKTKSAMGQLYSQVGELQSYSFLKQEGAFTYYKATFKNIQLQLIASLNNEYKLDAFRFVPFKEDTKNVDDKDAYILNTPNGKIFGTLSLPESKGKIPVVLLIAGSGPTDKDGNSPLGIKSFTYKLIADSLKKAGIACLRYDKRGIGQSADALVSQSDVDFNTYINDAAGFIKMLNNDTRFSGVIVAGHSEGSLIGMIAAQKEETKKYISIAGAGERIDKILLEQLTNLPPNDLAIAKTILDSLAADRTVSIVPQSLSVLFNSSIQPFMRTWLQYDPAKEIKKLNIPTLIIQGKNDIQVSIKNAEKLKKANPKAKLVLLPEMSHILKNSPADKEKNAATYTNSDLPLSPGLMSAMISFIKA